MKVVKYIKTVLEKKTAADVFGVVGGAIESLVNEIAKSDKLNFISTLSENSGVMMASGYSQVSNKTVVFITTTGPGVYNSVNGIASAFKENSKVLLITPQNSLEDIGKNPFQDSSDCGVDTLSILGGSVCYNKMITHKNQIPLFLNEALLEIELKNKPAHLSIPINILKEELDKSDIFFPNFNVIKKENSKKTLERIVKKINNKKTCFILGKRAFLYKNLIKKIINKSNLDTYTTPSGKGCISTDNQYNMGTIGMAGNVPPENLSKYDNIILIGEDVTEYNTCNWNKNIVNDKLIILSDLFDNDRVIDNYIKIKLENENDYKFILKNIKKKKEEVLNVIKEKRKIKSSLIKNLDKNIRKDAMSFFDTGSSYLLGINEWEINEINDYCPFNIFIENSSMTSGINNAIGASLYDKNKPIYVLTGDGSVLMNSHEFLLMKKYNLPVVVFIINNHKYEMVEYGQKRNNVEICGSQLYDLDFTKYSEFLGIKSMKIKNLKDLNKLKKWEYNEPLIVDINYESKLLPMNSRLEKIRG